MNTSKHMPGYLWLRIITIVFLVGLLLPSGSALAQAPYQSSNPYARKTPTANPTSTPMTLEAANALSLVSGNLLQDPSFEATYLTNYPYWTHYSDLLGTSLCSVADCGTGNKTAGPRTGTVWAWFGGVPAPYSVSGYVLQNVTIPVSCKATLEFYFRIGYAEAGSGQDDYFRALMDGNAVFSSNATQKNLYPSYKKVSINISAYADGGSHTVEFRGATTGQLVNFNLDDVSITTGSCYTISGNVGIAGTTLSYTAGTPKSVASDGSGNYSISLLPGWSGTITPSKPGYSFSPVSKSYTNLSASLVDQNYTPIPLFFTISGNVGVSGATLSYTDGTNKTVTSDGNGNYSITLPPGWSGTVTPSKLGYVFSPVSKSYVNLSAMQANENYTATFIPYTISGNVGIAGVTLTYTYETPMFVKSDSSGNYSITLPMGWSGSVTPYKIGYSFTPSNKSYTDLNADQVNQDYTNEVCPTCADKDTVGVFRPTNGLLYLKNANITGYADVAINYGLAGDYPVAGDWDGDGVDTIGVYRNSTFLLRNSNTVGYADLLISFGQPGDQPVVGDWDGDGKDTIGVYRPSTGLFLLRNTNSAGPADMSFYLGNTGDVGIAGDWDGDGKDTTGVFRPSNGIIFLKNTNATGYADIALNYGLAGDKPVTGDWNNDGIDTIGVLRGNMFYLRNSNTVGYANMIFALGNDGDMPIAGNWDKLP